MNACSFRSLALLAGTAILAWLAAARPVLAAERYEGLAHASGGGALVYRETHWLFREQGRNVRLVLYRCPNGDAFARKRVVETSNASAPDFDFVDGRDGYREGVKTEGAHRRVYWQANEAAQAKRRDLAVAPDAVIDAGFDAMVRAHWRQLADAQSVSARFLLPSRLDYLPVSIRGQKKGQAPGTLRLRMVLDAWYGFAAPATDLVYRVRDRWLVSFEGIGTIRDAKGRHQAVRIEFPDRLRAAEASEQEVASAANAPLTGRCQG